jgi:type IV pilus biogenesis/stability protein PilW
MRTIPPAAPFLLATLLALSGSGCAHGASARDKDSAIVHNDLGSEAVRNGRMQEALKSFDEAIKYDPDLAEAHMGRGVVLELGFGKLDEAEAEYRKAILLKPTLADAHNNLGQLLAKTGRLEEAVKEFDAASSIMLYREPWVARCNKGQALWRMGKKEEGVAELRTCLNFQPKYCQGWRELGRIQLADGQGKDAVASFEQYARTCDKTADAQQLLAQALLRTGQAARARESFQKCAELAEGTPLADECRKSGELLK